jgi:hypothetical protein
MANRIIKSTARNSSTMLLDCLSTLLVLELLHPSSELYLISPWLSDMPLINNKFGQFSAIMGDMKKTDLRLKDVLSGLAERGTAVKIMCRPDQPQTENFLRLLPPEIEVQKAITLHEKGLITAAFYLRGSMNFTYSGITLNDENIELSTDPEYVRLALIEARQRWKQVAA